MIYGSRILKAIILGFCVGVVGLVAALIPLGLEFDDNVGLDFLFKMRGGRHPPSDVVVVSIDRESSEAFNLPDNPDKWPRSVHAQLHNNLAEAGARVIAFDVHFIEARIKEDDVQLAKAIGEAGQ